MDTLLQRLIDVTQSAAPRQARGVLSDLAKANIGDMAPDPRAASILTTANDRDVARWTKQLRDLIQAVTDYQQRPIGLTWSIPRVTIRAALNRGGGYQMEVAGNPGDLLQLQAITLTRSFRGRLQRCPSTFATGNRCGRIFLRAGKRKFCSDRCQRRYYMREVFPTKGAEQ